jgi:hypothetical protein
MTPSFPHDSLPTLEKVSAHLTLWQPDNGGHVGFASGSWPGDLKSHARGCGSMVVTAHPLRSKAWTILSDKPWPSGPMCQTVMVGWAWMNVGIGTSEMTQHKREATFKVAYLVPRGLLLQHEKLIEFIHRNYAADSMGAWFFQNGPQRVYVELAATPFVWRLSSDFKLTAQTGAETQAHICYTDESGRVYFQTAMGFGLLHTLDVAKAAEGLELRLLAPRVLWKPADMPNHVWLHPSVHEGSQ